MDIQTLVRQYLPEKKVMQLATAANDQPWVCTVHYLSDEELNLYWLSTREREHSQQIEQNPLAALTVMVHENTPEESYVIGISIMGTAELIGEHADAAVVEGYMQKHGTSAAFFADVAAGQNPHKFYRLKPSKIVLFNNKDFPDDPRQEWLLT
jgi:uncharacterized protein YhbP (UPF0306 family)